MQMAKLSRRQLRRMIGEALVKEGTHDPNIDEFVNGMRSGIEIGFGG